MEPNLVLLITFQRDEIELWSIAHWKARNTSFTMVYKLYADAL